LFDALSEASKLGCYTLIYLIKMAVPRSALIIFLDISTKCIILQYVHDVNEVEELISRLASLFRALCLGSARITVGKSGGQISKGL
jgi:hypothetical protein